VKLLHAADLHIDSPLRGLASYEGAPAQELRTASRRALENLVELARTEDVDAVLLAGDIYDGDWLDYQTGLFFARQMSALGKAGIDVYLISGNHDAQSSITRRLRLPGNVRVFDTAQPQTFCDERLGLAVHGQGFARREVKDNLAVRYPAPLSGLFNVGLLHTALTGREGHEEYAPCKVGELQAKGYQYWALGHVHTREVVCEDPWIVFPGNIQGRHARETGPKGCTLVTVDDLQVTGVEHRDLDVARWEHLRVDVTGAEDLDEAATLVAKRLRDLPAERLHAVRVSLTGRTPAHLELNRERERLVNQIRLIATDLGALWVEKVRVETRPPDTPGEGTAGLLADLQRTARELRLDHGRLHDLVARSELLRKGLPADVAERGGIDPGDPQWLTRIAEEAMDLLAAMVAESRET